MRRKLGRQWGLSLRKRRGSVSTARAWLFSFGPIIDHLLLLEFAPDSLQPAHLFRVMEQNSIGMNLGAFHEAIVQLALKLFLVDATGRVLRLIHGKSVPNDVALEGVIGVGVPF